MRLKPKKEAVTRATIRLPQSLWKAAQHCAIDSDISVQELVRRALEKYLEVQKGGRA